ncbi:CBO0543 family protein [Neobacillus sp. FSL H8-0543]|uniref:CBO0543 family protein n=1 Tax=Neobacillus sp. FSL H8-0543 TaxID=2954672 RepID=UPI003158696F
MKILTGRLRMNTAKHLKDWNLPPLQKKSFLYWIKAYGPAVILASLLGTYLDLYLVGKKMYMFPIRPFPEVFSINIAFTLIGLPIIVFFYLLLMNQINKWGRFGLILFLSLVMPIFERFFELFGFFIHSSNWKHIYTFFGYVLFLTLIYKFYQWTSKR